MAIYKNDTGKWYIKCRNPTTGKKTTIRRNADGLPFQTKKEAREFEENYLQRKINLNIKFGELFEQYSEWLKMKNPTAIYDLDSLYKNHLSAFRKKKISAIKKIDVTNFQMSLSEREYSPAYNNKIISCMKAVLNWGCDQELINYNPIKSIKLLKIPPKDESLKYWTYSEFQQAISSLPKMFPSPSECIYVKRLLLFAYLTGARLGEVRALRWKKIDFKNNKILIDQHIAKGNVIKQGRKNNDRLILYMQQELYDLLFEMKNEYTQMGCFSPDNFVFPNMADFEKPIGANTPNRWVKKLAFKNNLVDIHFHGIRHSTASFYASEVGFTMWQVADRLGDTVEVIAKVYASFFDSAKRETAQQIDEYMKNKKKGSKNDE